MPVATITNSTADKASRQLTVRVFGDGTLPFVLSTPEGSTLRLTWDGAGHAVQSKVGDRYEIVKWAKA
jgi:alpha-D-xyloside xylohydrolase